ncbi:nitrilase family protein [Klebsiella pneumoniae]|jgi:predicted amidohydrolase|uniref:nitrilase family protein n=1 Tax=Klebsiella TaxID=570 RepID=UPI0004952A20|nr:MULTISPECIES: nitrilase family protein [Klebsiella]EFB3355327.1 acyltransferase [Escherichia coli]MDU4388430.1 nitrilase family protein [Klebsiella michiganensis]EGI4575358.1 acyltransferase [Escherichia coli]EIX9170677.1 nitrilase family protein [Klebsiella pneumoniae]EKT8205129.1 nitrilase family protein [Klebsiella pneumoniae]
MKKTLQVATVQFTHHANDKQYNLSVMETFILQAAQEGTKILAFPEMCITGYWHVTDLTADEVVSLAESVDGSPSLERITQFASTFDMAIGAGFIELGCDGKLYNSYAVCMPDGQRHVHRKLHAFEHPVIERGNCYTVFDTPWNVRVGILICWDNNLVENARATALLGADILIAPHQTGGTNSRSPHGMKPIPVSLWEKRYQDPEALVAAFQGSCGREWLMRWLPARAHDNGMFILFSNGVGLDNGEVRTGNAMILDPYGRVLEETLSFENALVSACLDLELLAMSTGRRWIHGRRPELYDILSQPQGYERDSRSARFSQEIPQFADRKSQ